MTNQPPKRKCTATTAAGHPCRAWATHDSDPPLCSAHAGRNRGAGAPAGNTNALKHGFYRSALTADEVADLITHADNQTLDDELALVRVMLRRLMQFLQTPIPELDRLPHDPPKDALIYLDTATRLTAIAPLVYRGARTIAYLLNKLGPGGSPRDWLDEALDELSDEFEIDL